MALREEIHDKHKKWDDVNNTKLKELVTDLDEIDHRLILCAINIGDWINVQGTIVVGRVLALMELRDY